MKHNEKYQVHYHYTDRDFNLKLFYIAKYMQETALSAFDLLDEPRKELTEKKLAFFLSKISFKFEGAIKKFDTINVETWALPPKSVSYIRNYRIYNETTGICAVRATSSWALVNILDKTIIHPNTLSDHFTAISTDSEDLGFNPVRRITIPDSTLITSSENHLLDKEIFYSDIDEYMHMNNTVYLDIIQNGLCKMMKNIPLDKLSALDISYDSGASEGDHLSVWGIKKLEEMGTGVYLRGKIDEINCFDAKAHFKV